MMRRVRDRTWQKRVEKGYNSLWVVLSTNMGFVGDSVFGFSVLR
jgi:hypothetical protein